MPGIENYLQEAEIRWFIMDTHGIMFGHPRPRYGIYAPVFTPSGVAAFGRDIESSKQVWSAEEGYPGDCEYRDFYRDVGFDLEYDYIKPYIHPDGIRCFTGVKYYKITGRTPHKEPYNRHRGDGQGAPATRATSCSTARSRSSTSRRDAARRRSSSRHTTPSCTGTGGSRDRSS